jgi:hypothetical protein
LHSQIKEPTWVLEPFLYDLRALKGAPDAFPVQNLVRIHLEVVELLKLVGQVAEHNR